MVIKVYGMFEVFITYIFPLKQSDRWKYKLLKIKSDLNLLIST